MNNRYALVTGASSGIGLAITDVLLKNGYNVIGIGRDFSKENVRGFDKNNPGKNNQHGMENCVKAVSCDCSNLEKCLEENLKISTEIESSEKENPDDNSKENPDDNSEKNPENFELTNFKLSMDLLDEAKLEEAVRIIKKHMKISMLVNVAGVGFYGLHENLKSKDLRVLTRTNLEVPVVLTNLFLKTLREEKGCIINLSSVTAYKSNPHGAAYGATKAALASFSKSLFEEVRKSGVKVVNILPDMTATNLYRNADFTYASEKDACLLPEDVAKAVQYVMDQDENVVVNEIMLSPQLHRIQKK